MYGSAGLFAVTLSIVIIPHITGLPALEGAGPQFIFQIAVTGDRILAACDRAIPGCGCDQSSNFQPAHRTVAVHQSPFLALTVILEAADPILAAVATRLDAESPAVVDAVRGSRVGDLRGWFRCLAGIATALCATRL